MSRRKGVWSKGAKKLTGHWEYNWPADRFDVVLDSRDRVTGETRRFSVYGETPEWNGWELERKPSMVG